LNITSGLLPVENSRPESALWKQFHDQALLSFSLMQIGSNAGGASGIAAERL